MLRSSSYTIYVDLPNNSEEVLITHGYTGAYDKVSKHVANYVRSLETRRPPKPLFGAWSPEPPINGITTSPSNGTIELLKQRGYLTEMSEEQEEEFFCQLANQIHEHELQGLPGYIIMPTYDCNLRCSYCFQDHMRTDHSYKHLLRIMDPRTVDRIISAFSQIEALHGIEDTIARQRDITFFGGEPLLEQTRPIVEYFMNQAKALGATRFAAITNGSGLQRYRDLLGPTGISFLQITLDGPAYEHDRRRIFADGSGSFALIAQNITLALDLGTRVSVRINIDRSNIDHLPELAEEIIKYGWPQYQTFSAYAAPIAASNNKTDVRTTLSTWQLEGELVRLQTSSPEMNVILPPDNYLRKRARRIFKEEADPIPDFQSSFCGAHQRMYVIDPFGDIYACWERTGDRNVRIGQIDKSGRVVLSRINSVWRGRTVAANPICRRCRYALYCGGGCAVFAENQRNDFNANFCDGFQARFRASVATAFLSQSDDKSGLAREERICNR